LGYIYDNKGTRRRLWKNTRPQALESNDVLILDNLGNLNYKQGLFDDAILEFEAIGAAQTLPTLTPTAKLGTFI